MVCLSPANEEHSELISRIVQESFCEQVAILKMDASRYPNYAGFETGEKVRMRMRSGDHAVLLFLGNTAVGTISYQSANAETGYIKRLGVLPAYRGMDYGRLLMTAAEHGLQLLGISKAEISLVSQFERLQNYYETMGYQVFDRKVLSALPFEISFMVKSLL